MVSTESVTFTIGQIPDEVDLIAVGDIFIFGQDPEQLENAAVTRNANAIYRISLKRLVITLQCTQVQSNILP